MESDLKLYLECLQKPSCPLSVKGTLIALADLLSTHGELKSVFRERKGLHILLQILIKKEVPQVHALYVLSCAVDSCVTSQNVLIQKGIFSLLYTMLKKGTDSTLFQPVTCLLGFLSQGNSLGQNKMKSSGILALLISNLRSLKGAAVNEVGKLNSILACLSSSVNNPRNTTNQSACMEILPFCLTILQNSARSPNLIQSLSSFIRLCLSDNDENQEKFAQMGGLKVCIDIIENADSKDLAWAVFSIINASPKGIQLRTDITIPCVRLLLKWMKFGDLCNLSAGMISLTLIIEHSADAKVALLSDKEGMSIIIQCLSVGEESVKKTAKLLLQLLFQNNTADSTEEHVGGSDSDLESASYEEVKRARPPTFRKPVEDTTRRGRPSTKPNVVVRSGGSWIANGGNKHRPRDSVIASKKCTLVPPQTPQPTPAAVQQTAMVRDEKNSHQDISHIVNKIMEDKMSGFLEKVENAVLSTSSRASSLASRSRHARSKLPVTNNVTRHRSSWNGPNIVVKGGSRAVANSKSNKRHRKSDLSNRKCTLLPPQTPQPTPAAVQLQTTPATAGVEKNSHQDISNIVNKIVEDKMSGLLEKVENVVLNTTSSPAISVCELSSDEESQSNQSYGPGLRRKDNSNTNHHVARPVNSSTSRRECFYFVSPTIQLNKGSAKDGRMSPEQNSQTPLIRDFFSNNPDLIPTGSEAAKAPLKGGQNISSSEDLITSGDNDSGNHSIRLHSTGKFLNPSSAAARAAVNEQSSYKTMGLERGESEVVPFTEQEIANLCRGFQMFGRTWTLILLRFEFHPSRSADDLQRQFSQIENVLRQHMRTHRKIWSEHETAFLQQGIKIYGHNWSKILQHYEFDSKTEEDLRAKQESLGI